MSDIENFINGSRLSPSTSNDITTNESSSNDTTPNESVLDVPSLNHSTLKDSTRVDELANSFRNMKMELLSKESHNHEDDFTNLIWDEASYENKIKSESSSSFQGYDHAEWYVSNAKQAASYFVNTFGFEHIAYKGLETGSKTLSAHVVENGNVTFEFISPIVSSSNNPVDNKILESVHLFIKKHGDGVKNVAFKVQNVDLVYKCAIENGARIVQPPTELGDENGKVKLATIEIFDDVFHTLINKDHYTGPYMPGYATVKGNKSLELPDASAIKSLPPISFDKIDHCVQNEDWHNLDNACSIYASIFGFHRFWSVDEKDVSTEFSALRSIVMASANHEVKMPINEPAVGVCKSQIEEFIEFYNGPGVQHIALSTNDIIQTVKNMRARGTEFIQVPSTYYTKLAGRLAEVGLKLKEDLNELRKLGILVDFDEHGYLLQLFTKPLSDRPTLFLEVIQRYNHNGFGAGNFKALFETIESEQKLRGTLKK